MKIFFTNSNKRVYPSTNEGSYTKAYIAQGEIFNYQVSIYNDCEEVIDIKLDVDSINDVSVRRIDSVPLVGHSTLVPQEETDGLNEYNVPDVLKNTNAAEIPPFSTKTFWVRVDTKNYNALFPPVGEMVDKISVTGRWIRWQSKDVIDEKAEISYYISDVEIKKKKTLSCLHWFYCDSISDFYKIPLWTDEFWAMCKKWMKNYSSHGNTHIYLPLFTPPLDGFKKPTQLVKVGYEGEGENKVYTFDFTNAAKYVKLAMECGIRKFECVHLFTQWGVEHPIRIYKNTEINLLPTNTKLYDKDIEIDSPEDKENLVVDVTGEATGPEYRNFLSQFFTHFKAFCEEFGIYDDIWFHVSDEPHSEHLENYRKAYKLLKELKPDIKIMDALSDRKIADAVIESMTEGGAYMPIPDIEQETFNDITHGAYFCCGPRGRYINRLLDTPMFKTRMLGSIMYKKNVEFFLHWGFDYYYESQSRMLIDPYKVNDGKWYPNWAPGDAFMVYPGEDGPLDSIRWENFYDTLQDFDLLSNLNIPKDSELLKDLETYKDFPRDADWIWNLRMKILTSR